MPELSPANSPSLPPPPPPSSSSSSSSSSCPPSSSSIPRPLSWRNDGGGGKQVIFGRYEIGRMLGCGAFGKVYHARHIGTGQSVAIKVLSKTKLLRSGLDGNVRREISAMRRLRHPNIIQLLDVLASRSRIYLVLELAKGGELFSRISACGRLSEDVARLLFQQLLSAVSYAHAHGVYHRDLKPENLLLLDDSARPRLKVSDFGLAALADQFDLPPPHGQSTHHAPLLFRTLCGTPAYVAPEVLSRRPYDAAKADIWSCGVILFVLVAGYLPFNDPNLMALYRKICQAEFRFPRWTSPEFRRLLARILHPDPAARISTAEIVHDPWFRKGLDADRFAAVIRPHRHDLQNRITAKMDIGEEDQNRDLNAFDLITLSPSLDLSSLFAGVELAAPVSTRERFVCTDTAEVILAQVESAAAGEEGMAVQRLGKGGRVCAAVEGPVGEMLAWVEVRRLNRELMVVEVEVEVSGANAAGEFWRKRLRPALMASVVPEPVSPVSYSSWSASCLTDEAESGSISST